MNEKPLCIYHHGCADGVAAAWAVLEYYRGQAVDIDLYPGIYGEAAPDVSGRDVIMVDFSYKRDALLPLIEQARSVLILDHHKTAQADLVDLPEKAKTIFDMERSGAMIAWDHFFPHMAAPAILRHIQDRDLWRFDLIGTQEITAAVYSHELDPLTFHHLVICGTGKLISEGGALLRKQKNDVAAIVRDATRIFNLNGVRVPGANVPWMYASDVAGELAKGQPFALTYYDDANGRLFSLRSDPDGLDVSQVAAIFKGGGHTHAAGFRLSWEEALSFEVASKEL